MILKKLKNLYVTFDLHRNTFYKVLDENKNYILVEDSTGSFWERKEYIEEIHDLDKRIEKNKNECNEMS